MWLRLIALFLFLPLLALAGVEQISEVEFRQLASDLAPKVNLFREVWAQDPEATFYGGTTRDYLYWLKGKFLNAHTPEAGYKIAQELRATPNIDVRDFIIGDSDVDVVARSLPTVKAEHFGIRKFDSISADIFHPETELGKNEVWQGHAPAEKVRLTKTGISQAPELGDGLHEIYTGKLSVHFADPEKFAQTKYAQAGENHPILLALRFLRLQAINYYRTYGSGYPSPQNLLNGMDPHSREEVEKVIVAVLKGKELKPFLERERFRSWLNGTIQKSFRSYTNPTAALEYMKMFGIDRLPRIYGEDKIEPLYQYVFSRFRDPEQVREKLAEYGVNPANFYEKVSAHFPDGYFYHGTKEEKNFRSMIFQGVLPSANGNAGAGLYGVPEADKGFAITWGGDKKRLLKLPVRPDAKIVDITRGVGARVWRDFEKGGRGNFEEFAEEFDIDILRYPYEAANAYVAKNSDVLGHAQGVYRQLMPFSKFFEQAKGMTAREILELLDLNPLTQDEQRLIFKECAAKLSAEIPSSSDDRLAYALLKKISGMGEEPEVLALASRLFETKGDQVAALATSEEKYQIYADWLRYAETRHLLLRFPEAAKLNELAEHGRSFAGQGTDQLRREFLFEVEQMLPILTTKIHQNGLEHSLTTNRIVQEALYALALKKEKYKAIFVGFTHEFVQKNKSFMSENLWNDFLYDLGKRSDWSKAICDLTCSGNSMAQLQSGAVSTLSYYFKNNYNPKYASILLKLIETYPQDSQQWLDVLFSEKAHWGKHPELFRPYLPYLAHHPDHGGYKLFIKRKFDQSDEWLANEDLAGKFFQRFLYYDNPVPGLDKAGWASDPKVLRKMYETMSREKSDQWDSVSSIIYKMLLKNQVWQKDPALLQDIIKDLNHSLNGFSFADLLGEKELHRYPDLVQTLIDYRRGSLNFEKLTEQLMRPEWAEHPQILHKLLDTSSNSLLKDIVLRVLAVPAWGKHPELLEKVLLILRPELGLTGDGRKKEIEELLAMPHFKSLPEYQKLGQGKPISYEKFKRYILVKTQPGKSFLGHELDECRAAFIAFVRRH